MLRIVEAFNATYQGLLLKTLFLVLYIWVVEIQVRHSYMLVFWPYTYRCRLLVRVSVHD